MGPAVVLWLALLLALAGWGVWKLLGLADERFWMGPAVFDEIPFDRKVWLAYEKNKDGNIRKRMFHDLRRRHLRPGMSRNEVLRLLGKPTREDGDHLDYYLGPDALDIDTNELILELDASGCVVRVVWNET